MNGYNSCDSSPGRKGQIRKSLFPVAKLEKKSDR